MPTAYTSRFLGTANTVNNGIATFGNSNIGTPRRLALYDFMIGCTASPPQDVAFRYQIIRATGVTDALGTTRTPIALDPADAAWSADRIFRDSYSPGPTLGTQQLLNASVNARCTFRWTAMLGAEMMTPATNNAGLAITTPTFGAALGIQGQAFIMQW